MKVLDVQAFETGMDETRQKITTLSSQLKQTEESVNQLISLSDAFKGEGPQAILTFFEQYHSPLLKTYHTFCADYQLTIDQMRHALFGFEPDPNGFIRQSFLENELNQGLIRARTTTIELTNEANAIMQTVSDIVALPHLREDNVVRACDEAIRYKQDTIEKLVQFDGQQTKALAPVESLLQSITEKIQFMEDIFIQGDTSIHVKTTAVEGLSCERPETEIKGNKAWYEVVANVIIGAIEGIVNAVIDIFKGLFDLLKSLFTDPIGFLQGIESAISNPVDTFNQLWGAVETAWERDVINGDARSRASFFSYTVVSVVGLKGFDKLGKVGKLGHTASKVDNNIPYNAFRTDKLKELVKTNVYANMQQKAKQTADLLKSSFSKEAMNKIIESIKNSVIITKARNTLEPANIKAASSKLYEDVVKAPIAKTQDWMQTFGQHKKTYSVHDGEPVSTFESRHRVLGGKNPPKLDGFFPSAMISYSMVEDYVTLLNPNATSGELLEASLSLLNPVSKAKKAKNTMDAIERVDTATNLVQGGNKVNNASNLTQKEKDQLEAYIKKLDKGTGNVKHLDDVPRIKEVEVNFKRNDKHDSEEFTRQLKDQEKGMNELTVDEYLKNREKYIEQGRAIEGNAAQQATREKALNKKIEELFENGMSWEEAEIKAKSWLKTQAALHNPDQIAGGNPLNIGGMGDKRINSSIGSQWKYRIDIVNEQIGELAKLMTPEQRKNTYLNVKLTH